MLYSLWLCLWSKELTDFVYEKTRNRHPDVEITQSNLEGLNFLSDPKFAKAVLPRQYASVRHQHKLDVSSQIKDM